MTGANGGPRQYTIEINGRTYQVEVESPLQSPTVVRVNGKEFTVSWQPGSGGAAPAVAAMPAPKEADALAGDLSLRRVTAPMPGIVLDVRVRPGDEVAFQQELCSLEAMKMKNSIRSPRAGRIASVEVAEGQSVAYGEPLFTFG